MFVGTPGLRQRARAFEQLRCITTRTQLRSALIIMGTTPSRPRKIGVVSELNIYPLKGAKGQRVQTAEVGDCGFQGDREFILVDETNLFTSQRKIGALAKVSIAVKPGDSITVSFDRDDFLTVPLVTEGEAETLTVWGKKINGLYQGDKVSHWFNRVLKQNGLRLFVSCAL